MTAFVRPEVSAIIGPVEPPFVLTPRHVAFTDSFEESPTIWTLNSGTIASRTGPTSLPSYVNDGSYAGLLYRSAAAGAMTASKTVSGLLVGRSYTASVWARAWPGATVTAASIGISGVGSSASTTLGTSGLEEMTYTFTATAGSHTVVLSATTGGVGATHAAVFEYATLIAPAITTRFPELPIAEGRVTIDENYAPHVQASVEVPLTSLALLESIDPRQQQRVTLTASDAVAGTSRTFDLGLRSRTVDHKSGRVTLELSSDEGMLFDKRRLDSTVDDTPRLYETSLRDVCEWALWKVPAIPRNLEANPRGLSTGSDAAYLPRYGWSIVFGTSVTSPSALPFNNIVRLTSTQTGSLTGRGFDSYGSPDSTNPGTTGNWIASPVLTPGETITISRYVRSNAGATRWRIRARFHDGNGNWIGSSVNSEYTPSNSSWRRPYLTVTVPEGAKYVALHTTNVDALDWTTTSILDMAGLMIDRSDVLRPFRDQALEPGTTDADVTATWDATNLQTNAAAGATLDGWVGRGGTLSRLTTGTFPSGIATAVRVTMEAGSNQGPYFEGGDHPTVSGSGTYNVSIFENQLYRVSAWVRTSASKSIRLSIQQRNSSGAITGANRSSAAFTTTANTWHRITFVFQAAPGAMTAGLYAYLASGTYTAGQTVDITGVMITEGTQDVPYFSGSSSDTHYAYSWERDAHLSPSVRRALVPRPPELFDWKPGQSIFDFVQPLLEASGLRLYCDENRIWRLIDPATYEVPGYVVVQSGHNATDGTDTISRNTEEWATGVLVRFQWADAQGVQREAFDFAGTDDKVLTVERASEYPGPGTAKFILQSVKGRGRVQDVVALTDLGATPTQDVTINLPGTLSQTGKVRRVVFGLKTGLMELGTRGLTDALPGTWALWNPSQTWSAVDPTLKWKDA